LGTSQPTGIIDPLLLRWCDVNDYNQWRLALTTKLAILEYPKDPEISASKAHNRVLFGLIWVYGRCNMSARPNVSTASTNWQQAVALLAGKLPDP
jgi:hypothetical protein